MVYVTKIEDGVTKLYNSYGHYQRIIGDRGAVNAQVQGDVVVVYYADGRVCLYNLLGHYMRRV